MTCSEESVGHVFNVVSYLFVGLQTPCSSILTCECKVNFRFNVMLYVIVMTIGMCWSMDLLGAGQYDIYWQAESPW